MLCREMTPFLWSVMNHLRMCHRVMLFHGMGCVGNSMSWVVSACLAVMLFYVLGHVGLLCNRLMLFHVMSHVRKSCYSAMLFHVMIHVGI